MASQEQEAKVSFKDTLNLPTTDFPIRPNSEQDDPAMVNRWQEEKLYDKTFTAHEGKDKYILHDGPPYANGNIHIGHAYNKVLKDIITKSQRMMGRHVPVTPGWDCHGLPIELKVSAENPTATPVQLKKKCREYAQHWINVQREEFKRLGVLMNWDKPYITMNYDYEASIVRAFGEFVKQGYIERKNKTVPWCISCKTVLASAEIEYAERKDPSLYVLFRLEQSVADALFPMIKGKPVDLVVWTTTPWTLPLNRAVLLKPQEQYELLEVESGYILLGKDLADALCAQMQQTKKSVAIVSSDDLIQANAHVEHPFIACCKVPLIPSEGVSSTDGTAFVHCAPGCGPEDYEVGIKNRLEIYSPVTVDGKYTSDILPQELAGMSVLDGQIWVIKKLSELNRLLFKATIKHSYPHCWRCRQGLIFRATKQWFCDLSKHNLKERVLKTIEGIQSFPTKSKNRLSATVEGRLEWCLSRQRVWGVPIPALLCVCGNYTYTNKAFIDTVAESIQKQGIEYWDTVTVDDLKPKDLTCPSCRGSDFIQEKDILDVWFDSGVSHFAVLEKNKALRFPADLYLEGKDQHRGWFQSSLLTAQVLEDTAPMKQILTHGFTVDQQGKKMSKSLGNVVSPAQMMKELGTDGLRLWAASIDYADDAVVSPTLLANVKEVFRKMRNNARFLLSNLYDYNHEEDQIALDALLLIDQYALQELKQFSERIMQGYTSYDITAVVHEFAEFSSTYLSSFYLDIIKDRLYVEKANGPLRRSAQTVCWYLLDTLTRLMAPMLSFTAEQISDLYQKNKKESIHLQLFANVPTPLMSQANAHTVNTVEYDAAVQAFDEQWAMLKKIRSTVLKSIEGLREKGIIKHSLESRITLCCEPGSPSAKLFDSLITQLSKTAQNQVAFFKEFFIVSQVTFATESMSMHATDVTGLYIDTHVARGAKCPRCWNWSEAQHKYNLCDRCINLV